jgi:endonuclease YncB( thermonuclease family)
MIIVRRALLCMLLLVAWPAAADTLQGRVVAISDGDTLTVLDGKRRQTRVRLFGIDTPERRQPYGSRAKQALSRLAFGKEVRVEVVDKDRWGRTVGRVYAGRTDVNAEMVREGAAWVHRRYSDDPELLRLEAEARRARRGLWLLPEAACTPPWEWRAASRNR